MMSVVGSKTPPTGATPPKGFASSRATIPHSPPQGATPTMCSRGASLRTTLPHTPPRPLPCLTLLMPPNSAPPHLKSPRCPPPPHSAPPSRRSQSHRHKQRHPTSPLPHHLQDHTHPKFRKRRPSTLSTHSYNVRSPIPTPPAQEPHYQVPRPVKTDQFLFPSSSYSPGSGYSPGPSPKHSPPPGLYPTISPLWYLTPNSKSSPTFDSWALPRSCSWELPSVPGSGGSGRQTSQQRQRHKVQDMTDVGTHPQNAVSHFQLSLRDSFCDWPGNNLDSSLSSLSCLSHQAVVHSCIPPGGGDYLSPRPWPRPSKFCVRHRHGCMTCEMVKCFVCR